MSGAGCPNWSDRRDSAHQRKVAWQHARAGHRRIEGDRNTLCCVGGGRGGSGIRERRDPGCPRRPLTGTALRHRPVPWHRGCVGNQWGERLYDGQLPCQWSAREDRTRARGGIRTRLSGWAPERWEPSAVDTSTSPARQCGAPVKPTTGRQLRAGEPFDPPRWLGGRLCGLCLRTRTTRRRQLLTSNSSRP